MGRIITIGDIHGCVEEFALLLEAVSYQQGKDRLILLGDLIDRGPDPAGVVKLAREVEAACIMGNHEEKALRWRRHEKIKALWKANNSIHNYINPMLPIHPDRLAQWAEIPDKDWDWIATWPCYIHINDIWTAVHAGCFPGVEIEKQKPNDLMRIRYVDPIKMKVVTPTKKGEQPDNCVFWTELWKGPRRIIYGHETYKDSKASDFALGIDTGCVYGEKLTAIIFESRTEDYPFPTVGSVTMKASKAYVNHKPWNEE